jgi:hypothetical protein
MLNLFIFSVALKPLTDGRQKRLEKFFENWKSHHQSAVRREKISHSDQSEPKQPDMRPWLMTRLKSN